MQRPEKGGVRSGSGEGVMQGAKHFRRRFQILKAKSVKKEEV